MFEDVITMVKDAITAASDWLTSVFTSCGNEFFAIFISAFFIYTVYRLLLRPLIGAGVGASDRALSNPNKKTGQPSENDMANYNRTHKGG